MLPSHELSEANSTTELSFRPEKGCIKSYQWFSALQHHLDCRKHERVLEQETLLDKAVRGYAIQLEEQFENVPRVQRKSNDSESTLSSNGLGT